MYQNSLGMIPNVLNTDPIFSVPNATGVPNVNTSKRTENDQNDPAVTKNRLVYQPVYQNVNCTIVHQMYQKSTLIMPNVPNTDPMLSVPNATGVPNVPKMTKNDLSVPERPL